MTGESKSVLEALNQKEYDWKTIASVARDTGLPREEVKRILEHLAAENEDVVKKLDPDGQPIYTTRAIYNGNLWNRTLSAISGRIK